MEINLLDSKDYIYGGNIYKYVDSIVPCVFDPSEMRKVDNNYRSGGVYFRFVSDSPNIKIKILTVDYISGNYPHFGISAQYGIAYAYRNIGEDQWYNLGCNYGRRGEELIENVPMNKYTINKYDFIIFMPTLCFVKSLTVECNENCCIEANHTNGKKIIFLGGKTTKGIGVTSNAFTIENIFARKNDCDVYSICFENKDYLSNIVKILPILKKEQVMYDNIFLEVTPENINIALYENNIKTIVTDLISLCKEKLIIWNKPTFYNEKNKDYEKFVELIEHEDSKKIKFCNNFGLLLYSYDMDKYTYSENFINDYGYNLIYERLKWNI